MTQKKTKQKTMTRCVCQWWGQKPGASTRDQQAPCHGAILQAMVVQAQPVTPSYSGA